MPDSTQQPSSKFGRFICPNCQAINVEAGDCKKCGADLETGSIPDIDGPNGDDHGHHLREMQSPGMFSKRQLMFGGAGILLLVSLMMMLMGGPKPAPGPDVATTTTSTTTAPALGPDGKPLPPEMPKESSDKARDLAVKYAGFKDKAPESYVYEDTSPLTGQVPSFGLTSQLHNQRLLFVIWDNPAPLQRLELVAQKVPFAPYATVENIDKIKVARGTGVVAGSAFKWFTGRYWNLDKKEKDQTEMTLVGAFKSTDPSKAIVLVARPFDGSNRLDWNSVLWMVDTMAVHPDAQTATGTPAEDATKTADEPLATGAQVNSYRNSLESLIRAKFNAPEEAKNKKVKVVFAVKPDGSLGKIEIADSSRNETVDKAVLKAITTASPFPKPPHTKDNIETLVTTDGGSLKLSGT
jgi:TonB family protein